MSGADKPPPVSRQDVTLQDDDAARALRLQAEARLRLEAAKQVDEQRARPSPEEMQQTLHELRVHQIELEMQNEELRRAQLELDASRARWFDLYEVAPVGYCTVSEPGLIVQANLTLTTRLGVARSALVRQPFSRFIVGEDQDAFYLMRKQIIADGIPRSCELRMVQAEGQPWWAHLSVTEAMDGQGASELRIVLSDISARKQAEAESAALQAQLQQAQKMESVGRLAGGVAHDYNNMLTVILGHAELALLRADAPPLLRDDLTEIYNAATRSARITQQLLSFARKQVVSPQVLDVNATVAHALTMLRPLLGERVQCTWAPGGDLWPVTMDAAQMDQILTNLCLNARDAIGGTGTLVISTGNRTLDATQSAVLRETVAEAVPGDFVQLTVTDSGCGMSGETLTHLFEPFYTTKGVGEGTGLGLASVYGAVRQTGGFIAVASELGAGTTFSVYLPRCTTAPAVSQQAPATVAPQPRGDETILVVEDEPAVRRVTARTLEQEGYTVLTADHPREAIRLAQAHGAAIALVLTDVQMPEMSGYDLVEALRSAHPHLRHLFMSGYPDGPPVHGLAGERRPEDAVRFIAKPFTLATLTAKVRQVLDGE